MFPAALLKALLSPQGLHGAGRCLPLRCSGKSAWPGAHQCHRGEDRTVWPRSLLPLLQAAVLPVLKTSVTGRGHRAFSGPPMAAQELGDGRASCLCTPRRRELCWLAALTQAPELRQPQDCCSAPRGMTGAQQHTLQLHPLPYGVPRHGAGLVLALSPAPGQCREGQAASACCRARLGCAGAAWRQLPACPSLTPSPPGSRDGVFLAAPGPPVGAGAPRGRCRVGGGRGAASVPFPCSDP